MREKRFAHADFLTGMFFKKTKYFAKTMQNAIQK